MNKINNIQNGSPVAHISEEGYSLTIVENVTRESIRTERGVFRRDTGESMNPNDKSRLSTDPNDLHPLLRELKNETGEQFLFAETSECNAAIARTIAKRNQTQKENAAL